MMKIKYTWLLLLTILLVSACTEEDIIKNNPMNVKAGIPVEVQLSISNLPKTSVASRADAKAGTDEYALQVFIFNEEGKLTGYTHRNDIIKDSEPTNTDGTPDPITIKTLTGKSYIYAIVNYKTTTYGTTELDDYMEALAAIEADPRANVTVFNHDTFLQFEFSKVGENVDLTYYKDMQGLMSGMYRETKTGENTTCFISIDNNGAGAIYTNAGTLDQKPTIYLKYIGSDITFNLDFGDNFTLNDFYIYNIPTRGKLIEGMEGKPGSLKTEIGNDDITQAQRKITGKSFTIYLPENLQEKKDNTNLNKWLMRETQTNNSKYPTKAYKYAPDYGTYVVLKGEFDDRTNKHMGTVEYTIHLGDFDENRKAANNDFNDFNVDRHYHYTYTLSANNVYDIKVVAKVDKEKDIETETYPGTEGVIIDYSDDANAYIVDSHYEAVLFELERPNTEDTNYKPYTFLVREFDKLSPPVNTTESSWEWEYAAIFDESQLHADNESEDEKKAKDALSTKYANERSWYGNDGIEWIHFAAVKDIKANAAKVTNTLGQITSNDIADLSDNVVAGHPRGGVIPFLTYTYTGNAFGNGTKDCKMGVRTFIRGLREGTDDVWGTLEETPIGSKRTFVAFIKENYYSKRNWNEYTNQPMRAFYLVKEGHTSTDDRSIWYEVKFAVQQRSIQTFYNTDNAGSTIAYGCEYENNEGILMDLTNDYQITMPEITTQKEETAYSNRLYKWYYDQWNGLYNTMLDIWYHECEFGDNDGHYWSLLCVKGETTPSGETVSTSNGMIQNMHLAFINRNRDNNRNGRVDADEIRWYTPSTEQYCGLWIGEQAYDKEARLCYYDEWKADMYAYYTEEEAGQNDRPFFKEEYIRHYYTSTPGMRNYWGEEGFSFGNFKINSAPLTRPYYLRCVRNLRSKNLGINFGNKSTWNKEDGEQDDKIWDVTPTKNRTDNNENGEGTLTTEEQREYQGIIPNKYYTYEPENRIIWLDNVEQSNKNTFSPLNQSIRASEVANHNERSEFNRPGYGFQIAEDQTDDRSWNWILNKPGYNSFVTETKIDETTQLETSACGFFETENEKAYASTNNTNNEKKVGEWRVPVLNELALIILVAREIHGNTAEDYNDPNIKYIVNPGNTGDAARTSFQLGDYRKGGYYARIQAPNDEDLLAAPSVMLSMSNNDNRNPVRPVRDVKK